MKSIITTISIFAAMLPCMATSMPPIPVEQKVRGSEHIFIGVATKLVITDPSGKIVSSPQADVQGDHACRLTVNVIEVIRSKADPVPKSVTVTYSNKWIRKVDDEQNAYVGKKMIYFLCGKDFTPFNGFQFVESVEKASEIKDLLEGKSEKNAEPAGAGQPATTLTDKAMPFVDTPSGETTKGEAWVIVLPPGEGKPQYAVRAIGDAGDWHVYPATIPDDLTPDKTLGRAVFITAKVVEEKVGDGKQTVKRLMVTKIEPVLPLTSNQITPVPQEIAICEAVFLYQYAQTKGNTHTNVPYVLSMKGSMKDKDFADIVMKKLANHNPQFRRSAGSFKQEAWIELSIEAIKSIDDKHVQVSGGYARATSDITLGTYFLEERDGKWLVTNCEIHARGGG